MQKDEQVLCIARTDLEKTWKGQLPTGIIDYPSIDTILALPLHFIPRGRAETDPSFKQVIPYQLFRVDKRYFVFRRGAGVGENRLSGRLSLGIGGHINSSDTSGARFFLQDFYAALERERDEELIVNGDGTSSFPAHFRGWINDDSDPVGQVHIGAVFITDIQNVDQIAIRPDGEDLVHEGWLTASQVMDRAYGFEKWSVLAVQLVENT